MRDVSKTTVLILLILTVLVSVLGTLTVLNAASVQHLTTILSPETGQDTALSEESIAEKQRPIVSDSTETVSFTIAETR